MKIIMLIAVIVICPNVETTYVDVNTGIYIERLPNISFYQTTRQILLKFKKPVNILESLNCSEKYCSKNKNICEFVTNFKDSFSQISTNLEAKQIDNSDPILADDGEIFDFQFATRNHVKRMFTNDYEISVLLQRIKDKNRNITVYEGIYSNIVNAQHLNLTCTHSEMKDIVLLDFSLRTEWLRSFVSMCQTKRLNLDIINMDRLASALNIIKKESLHDDYVVALTSLSQYYTMPLIECILSPSTGIVGIHVPLIRRHLQGLHMKKVLTPTYAWENYTCTVNIPSFAAALVDTSSHWEILLPQCDPYREELCFVTEVYSTETLSVSCMRQVLSGGTVKQFASICPVTCRETGTNNQFLVPVGSHKLLVTHPKHDLQLKCPLEMHTVNITPNIGTLLVTVPCHCYFYDESGGDLYPRYPCVDPAVTFDVRRVIPAVWTKYDGLTLPSWEKVVPQFEKIQDCLNGKWIEEQKQVQAPTPILIYIVPVNLILILTLIPVIILLYVSILKKFTLYIPYQQSPSFANPSYQVNHPIEVALKIKHARLAQRKLPARPSEDEEDYLTPTTPKTDASPELHHYSEASSSRDCPNPILRPQLPQPRIKNPLYVNMNKCAPSTSAKY